MTCCRKLFTLFPVIYNSHFPFLTAGKGIAGQEEGCSVGLDSTKQFVHK